MTSLPARPQYKDGRANTSSAFSSSLTGLFEETCILVGIQFPLFIMASTSKALLTPDDTHDCCVFCLGEEHARDVFEGAVCVHCELSL